MTTRDACDAGCERRIIVRMFTDRSLRLAVSGLVFAALSACSSSPDVDPAAAPTLSAMAHALMDSRPRSDTMQYVPAPPGIHELLDLEEVRIFPEGVYFVTDSAFVQEDGVFVPRDPASFKPTPGDDPSYMHVALDVFVYHIAG
jgi:hypothetical protein